MAMSGIPDSPKVVKAFKKKIKKLKAASEEIIASPPGPIINRLPVRSVLKKTSGD
jgi:hypothetical protein